jgi:hypothetical protein
VIPYASQTSGPNRRAIERAGWRQFVSPDTRPKNGVPTTAYALDNGAWGAFLRGQPWDAEAFERLVGELGTAADFVVVPDAVSDRAVTLERAHDWLPRLAGLPRYLAVQDGMTWTDVDPFVPELAGIFLGGSTAWKLETLADWGGYAHARALRLHVGRVNSVRRIRRCGDAGADSFDGSVVSRYAAVKLRLFDNEVRQKWLF